MAAYNYTVLFEPDETGGYIVTCPALPGLVTEGDNYDQAVERAKEAIEVYIESLLKDGEAVAPDKPLPLDPVKTRIQGIIPDLAA